MGPKGSHRSLGDSINQIDSGRRAQGFQNRLNGPPLSLVVLGETYQFIEHGDIYSALHHRATIPFKLLRFTSKTRNGSLSSERARSGIAYE
jgi:hypothetical protein